MSLAMLGVERVYQLTRAAILELQGTTDEPGKIAEVEERFNTAYPSSALELRPFQQVTGEDPRAALVPEWPVLFMVPDDGGLSNWTASKATGTYGFMFSIWADGEDEMAAKLKSYRLLVALLEMLKAMHSHPECPLHWGSGGETKLYFQPTFTVEDARGGSRQVSDVRLMVSVEMKEP